MDPDFVILIWTMSQVICNDKSWNQPCPVDKGQHLVKVKLLEINPEKIAGIHRQVDQVAQMTGNQIQIC